VKTDGEVIIFSEAEHMNNSVTPNHTKFFFQMSSPIGKYFTTSFFYIDWKEFSFKILSATNESKESIAKIVTHDIDCETILIATANETKQTRHHRNMKRCLLIDPLCTSKFKKSWFLFTVLAALFWLWRL